VGVLESTQFERSELLGDALQLSFVYAAKIGVDHESRRSKLLTGKSAPRCRKLLDVNDGMRMVALTGFVGIAGLEGALILARRAIEERSQRGGAARWKKKSRCDDFWKGAAMRINSYASFAHKDG